MLNVYQVYSNPAELDKPHNSAGSYWYARASGKPTPELEDIIAKNAEWSYWYAKYVLLRNGISRFIKGEAILSQDAEWAYEYAKNVLHKRFPEGEFCIKGHRWWREKYHLEFPDSFPEMNWEIE